MGRVVIRAYQCGLLMLLLGTLAGCRYVADYAAGPSSSQRDAGRDATAPVDAREDRAGLDGEVARDLAADTSPPDAPNPDLCAPPPSCVVDSVTVEAVADTVILPGIAAGLNFGPHPVINIGHQDNTTNPPAVGLFRFDLSAIAVNGAVDPARLRGLRLVLHQADVAEACAPNCGSCAAIHRAGEFAFQLLRSDWGENAATWKYHKTGAPWSAPGADGSLDHGIELGRGHFALGQPLTLESALCSQALRAQGISWLRNKQLSFRVRSLGGKIVAATRDQPDPACGGTVYTKPTLTISYCR